MPYISQEDRSKLKIINISQQDRKEIRVGVDDGLLSNPGNLNFIISTVANMYLEANGLSYTKINEVIGVLECAKLELYRRIAAPYEDSKIDENGDVYTVHSHVKHALGNQVSYI
jgi:hypothetical protein